MSHKGFYKHETKDKLFEKKFRGVKFIFNDMLVNCHRDFLVVTSRKEELLMIEKSIQERILLLREELYVISNQLNYELTHPKLVTISQQLDQLLNQYAKIQQKA